MHARIQKVLSVGPTLTSFYFLFIYLLVDEGREDLNATSISGGPTLNAGLVAL